VERDYEYIKDSEHKPLNTYLEDPNRYGRIILKWILKNSNRRAWALLIWLRQCPDRGGFM
jgi:hypothetical protein